ncbi:exopolysaccharide biosynthesis protein [Paracoccus liaowanqingii]|uniref:Exopolysaccharide biosynthesis protein n=1 Tax=Paracoccus liaowanqingii TaxID=2560053 RepID=A0A4Z1BY18_9RHOB|nr:exopolysaccharide biosynthesis protein [Paracoccus liaowanqingii]TGN55709.1 exopolysaccharide biosynthesis protein [Paracoccus liaowanqingii]
MISDQLDAPTRRPTLSEVLSALAATWDQPRISVAQLMTALGDRGLIGLLLILAFANVIPNPPGTSAVLGLPMLYLSWQLMRGGMPWLPRFLAARSFDIGHFRTVVSRAMPYLNRVERLLRPRLPAFSGPSAKKLLGGICLILSIVLVLPIPFGNLLPAAAIAIIALGALERDGIWIAGGVLFGIVSTVFMAGAIVVVTRALLRLIGMGL